MRVRQLSVLSALVLASVLVAGPADAGPPGKWTVVSGGGVSSIDEPGLYRTADGTLHVAMHRNADDFSVDYVDVAQITEAGKLTSRADAIGAWEAATDATLLGSPDGGVRMVFGGIRSGAPSDPYRAGYLWQASAPASGVPWTLSPTAAVSANTGYASSGTGATTLPNGTLVAGYASGSAIYYEVGATGPQSFAVADCCAYNLTLVQSLGFVYAAWHANGDLKPDKGHFVRAIYPNLGPIIQVPGSVTAFHTVEGTVANAQHVAMAARNGGGVYIAYCKGYPTCSSVVLWKYGASTVVKVPDSEGASHIAISPAPSGRLWVAFEDADDNLHAVRTNKSATKFGAVRTLARPKTAGPVYKIGIEGTRARADLLFNDGSRILHQQLFAGLTLTAQPSTWNGDNPLSVRFRVTDAGEVVANATVKAKWNGKKLSCKTDAVDGACRLNFPAMNKTKITVTAKKSGYAPDETKLQVN
jgi:hypothetical protein